MAARRTTALAVGARRIVTGRPLQEYGGGPVPVAVLPDVTVLDVDGAGDPEYLARG